MARRGNSKIKATIIFCNDLQGSRAFDIRAFILARQVLLSRVRKEAALDLHSPFSTSHNKPIRPPDRPLASPFLTFLPFASFELWPQKWGRVFCVLELIDEQAPRTSEA
jgi:hypothetical protein